MRIIKLTICTFLIFITSCIVFPAKEKEIIKVLKDSKISIQNLETDSIVQKKMIQLLGNKKIIGLGEATHGTNGIKP